MIRRAALVLFALSSRALAQQAPSPPLAQSLTALAQQLAPGQPPVSPMLGSYGAHRAAVVFAVQLGAGHCYTVLGAGGAGVADVDMYLFDPAGMRVGVDRRDDAFTQILHCPVVSGPFRVELKVKRGAGEVAFQVFEGQAPAVPPQYVAAPPAQPQAAPPQAAPQYVPPPPPAQPPIAAPPPVVPPAPVPTDFLGAQLQGAASTFAPGQRLVAAPLGGVISEGHPSDQYVTLEAGRCYTVITVAAPTMRHVLTYLWEPGTNRRVATDRPDGVLSHFNVCASLPGAYHFQAKADTAYGEFRTGVYTR